MFDQGLGRSLWFVDGADATRITETIARFSQSRQPDLWSGVGLACVYAGGAAAESVELLLRNAGSYQPQLAQGAAFAAKARLRADNLTTETQISCRILCGMSAEDAAQLTDLALSDLPDENPVPAYEVWRQRIQANWTQETVKS